MADSSCVTAPIGGGKTLWLVVQMCKTLEKTEQGIVTNCPIILNLKRNPEETLSLAEALVSAETGKSKEYWTFQEYADRFIRRRIHVADRMVYLEAHQAVEFYRYIPTFRIELTDDEIKEFRIERFANLGDEERCCFGYRLPMDRPRPKDKFVVGRKETMLCDFFIRGRKGPLAGCGVDYFIDEGHKLFPAREWMDSPVAVEDYQSELRKLNDNFWLATQHLGKLDKNMRRNMTEWWQVQNMSKTRLWMGVAIEDKFRWHWYNTADVPGRADKPDNSGWYKLDPKRRYHFLYRTMAGSSIDGGQEGVTCEQSRFKGRHPAWWGVFLVVMLVVCFSAPWLIQHFTDKAVSAMVGGTVAGVNKGLGKMAPSLSMAPQSGVSRVSAAAQLEINKTQVLNGSVPAQVSRVSGFAGHNSSVTVTGLVLLSDGSNVKVYLSDGRVADSRFGEVEGWGRTGVRVFGDPDVVPYSTAVPAPSQGLLVPRVAAEIR